VAISTVTRAGVAAVHTPPEGRKLYPVFLRCFNAVDTAIEGAARAAPACHGSP